MITLVLDATIYTSHLLARRVISRLRASWSKPNLENASYSLAPQAVQNLGNVSFVSIQYDNTFGNWCAVGWDNGPVVPLLIGQLFVLDFPVSSFYIKNAHVAATATASNTIVVKAVTAKQ